MANKKFSLEAMVSLADGVTAPISKIEKGMRGFSKSMQKNLGGVGKDIKSLDAGINKVAVGMGVLATASLAASAALVQSTAMQADEWSKKARQIGITTEQLQKLDYVANMQGVTSESLIKSYEKMNKNIGDLQNGTGALSAYLVKSDAAFLKQLRGVKNSDEAFLLLMDKINKAPNEFAKASLAQAAFGKSGMDMLRVAEAGADGIASLMSETQKYGLISTDAANAAETFLDEQSRIKQILIGLKNQAFNALIPVILQITNELRLMFEEMGGGAEIVRRLKSWIEGIDVRAVVGGIKSFFGTMVDLGRAIGAVITFLKPLAPIIFGLVIAVKAITVAMTLYNAVLWLVSLNPITLIILAVIAAVALLALGVSMMVKHWDSVVAVLKVVGGFFVNLGQTIMKWMLTPINLMLDAVGSLLKLLSKIPGLGEKLAPAMEAINGFQSGMNKKLTGTEGAYDYGGVWSGGYSNPATRAQSTSSTTTTRNTVDIVAPSGYGLQPRGGTGAPRPTLNYGGAQ